jgi:hypothetical protein
MDCFPEIELAGFSPRAAQRGQIAGPQPGICGISRQKPGLGGSQALVLVLLFAGLHPRAEIRGCFWCAGLSTFDGFGVGRFARQLALCQLKVAVGLEAS